jgi:outer membrane protein OmpA-like peptidoglycan-associated protein
MRSLWGLLACLLTACSTPDTVTLVRSLGDTPAEVTVQGETQTRTLRAPGDTVDVRDTRMQPRTSTTAETRALFGPALDATPHAGLPVAPRQYTILFARGQVALPLDAETILAAILEEMTTHPVVAIDIVGHTDRVGRVERNDRLSQARAVAVRDAFVARGVSAALLHTEGRGERAPVIPTADGVPEPLNRRVDIVVH